MLLVDQYAWTIYVHIGILNVRQQCNQKYTYILSLNYKSCFVPIRIQQVDAETEEDHECEARTGLIACIMK